MKRYSFKEDGTAIGFLFLLAALYFFPVLLNGNSRVLSRIGTDTWGQYFHWRHFGYTTLANGEIPLWNPYIFSGTPYVAGIQSAIFYPLNLLYLIFEIPFAVNFSIALHCLLASLFTYLFGRYIGIGAAGSTLSAMVFAYAAPYFLHIYAGHLSNLSTMIWLPLVILGLEVFLAKRHFRYAVFSGIPLSLQVLSGHPQYLFYSTIAAFLYLLFYLALRRRWREAPYFLSGFFLFVLIGILLSAVQLLPTLEFTGYSAREALTYEWISAFSLPPENLITLILPDFFGDGLGVPYWGKNYLWEMSLYLGVVPLILVILGAVLHRTRHVLAFLFLAVVALVLALGRYTPLLTFLYHYVPGFNLFRGLSKFIFVFTFASAMIAGYGLKKLETLAEKRDPVLRNISYALLALSFLLASLDIIVGLSGQDFWRALLEIYGGDVDRYLPPPQLTDSFLDASRRVVSRDLLKASILVTLFGLLLLIFAKIRRLPVKLMLISILAIAAFDLWSFGSRYLVTFDPEASYMDKELKAFLKSDKEPFRVATSLLPLLNMTREGIENVGGYDAFVLKRYSEFINSAQGLPVDEPNLVMRIHRTSPLLDLLNVKYYVVEPAASISPPMFDLVFQNPRYRVYRGRSVFPRSYVVHDARVIKDREAIFQHMTTPGFDAMSSVIVEDEIDNLPRNATIRSPLPKIVEYSPNRVGMQATLMEPGLLVLADTYYPGWKAFVDGRESRIYRANYVMRAVFLPKGSHSVEFRYEPLSFKIGAAISLASFFLLSGAALWLFLRRRIPIGMTK